MWLKLYSRQDVQQKGQLTAKTLILSHRKFNSNRVESENKAQLEWKLKDTHQTLKKSRRLQL